MKLLLQLFLFITFCTLHAQSVKTQKDNSYQSNNESVAAGDYSFIVLKNATVTAFVQNSLGTVIREIFSGVEYKAGTYTLHWDGRTSNGEPAPKDNYVIKIIQHNIRVTWLNRGLANSADASAGSSYYRSYMAPQGIAFIGDTTGIFALGYNEATQAQFAFSVSKPNLGKMSFGTAGGYHYSYAIAAVDSLVYIGAQATNSENKTWVWAANAKKNYSYYTFRNGTTVSTKYEGSFSALGYKENKSSIISGLAVKNRFIFITRSADNEVMVCDRITGSTIKVLSINKPNKIAASKDGYIWLQHNDHVIEKYKINPDGNLLSTGFSITSVSAIGGFDISPDNNTIAVCDLDNGLKGFNTHNGMLRWSFGSAAGYMTEATVSNAKWYWKDVNGYYSTFIKYLDNGNFYLGDEENRRTLIFDSSRKYLSQISWLQTGYATGVDNSDPTRLIEGYREYKIDYTKLSASSKDWYILRKNWSGNIIRANYDGNARLNKFTTLLSGKTYAILSINNVVADLYELDENSVAKKTGLQCPFYGLQIDGKENLYYANRVNSTIPYTVYTKRIVTSPDGKLAFGQERVIANISDARIFPFTFSVLDNKIGYYDISARNVYDNKDFHTAFSDTGAMINSYFSLLEPGTRRDYYGYYPIEDLFDNGNGVNLGYNGGGGLCTGSGRFFLNNYHGEFWGAYSWGAAQTNKWNLYDAINGVRLLGFGVVTNDYKGQEAPPMVAGNTLSGTFVIVKGTGYLWHNDESYGTHVWKFDNLSSIKLLIAKKITTVFLAKSSEIDLSIGLQRGKELENGRNGWHRDTSNYHKSVTNRLSVVIGMRTEDAFSSPDVTMTTQLLSGNHWVERVLSNVSEAEARKNKTSNWRIFGNLLYNNTNFSEYHFYGYQMIQILDSNDRVIASFYVKQSSDNKTKDMYINSEVMTSTPIHDPFTIGNQYQPFEISAVNGIITCTYSGFTASTTTTSDANAVMTNPVALRLIAGTNLPGATTLRQWTIKDFRFVKN